jgi:hypothetical protein
MATVISIILIKFISGDIMNPAFWTNTIWYVLLGITSVVSFMIIVSKPDHRKFNIAFIFTVLGLVYSIESALMGL